MKKRLFHELSRRNFLQMSAGFGALAALGTLGLAQKQQDDASDGVPTDYKALVCVYLEGGNDGHNTVVPLSTNQFLTYQTGRSTLALATNEILPINAAGVPFGLHYGLPKMQQLYTQNKVAIVANVGNLVRPTVRADLTQVPTQLFSHSDQTLQAHTGATNSGIGTGWGGRVVDAVSSANSGAQFPSSISFAGQNVFCRGNQTTPTALMPNNDLSQSAMTFYPQTAADARFQAQREIVQTPGATDLITAANEVLRESHRLSPILRAAQGNPGFSVTFPSTSLGNQLKEAARIIGLNSTLNIHRQVFFVSLGGFDTHGSQSWTQWNLLQQVDDAMWAFYTATQELGLADKVTAFTASEFGRTLQPNGGGSDHGWGNHHFVVGGAVRGGAMYGTFPNLALNGPDDHASRGVLIPTTSSAQFGATLAKWFGVADAQMNALFPPLANFATRDLGFMF